MSILFSLSSFLIQIFLMCMFGQETMSEYHSLSYGLYTSDWPTIIAASSRKHSNNCHVILIMFMENLKCETKVTIGKVFTLALKTFSSVKKYPLIFFPNILTNIHFSFLFLTDFDGGLSSLCYSQVKTYGWFPSF